MGVNVSCELPDRLCVGQNAKHMIRNVSSKTHCDDTAYPESHTRLSVEKVIQGGNFWQKNFLSHGAIISLWRSHT